MVELLDPADIPRPGTARDPGVRAAPALLQDSRGAALNKFSKDMSVVAGVFADLGKKRQDAEDNMFLDTYQLEYAKRAGEIEAQSLNSPDISNPKFVDILDKRLEEAHKTTLDEVLRTGGFTPSENGRNKATEISMGMRTSTAKSAAGKAHNQRVESLLTSADQNINEIARRAAANGDLDGGLASVDALAGSISNMVAPEKAKVLRESYRKLVLESVVEGHIARKEYDKAQAIVDAETGFYKQPKAPAVLEYPVGEGLVEKGNVDLNARPTVQDGDKIATLRSVSRNIDGVEVLVPSVTDDGKIVSDDEAFEIYRRTGKHLGKFSSADAATAYAKRLSSEQGTRYGETSIEYAIFNAAKENGADPAVALAIVAIESGGNPTAKNPASSAGGLFQFTTSTGKDFDLPADASTATIDEQAKAGARLIAANSGTLRRALGGEPTPAEIYLAHFLGAGDAIRVLRADADTKASDILTDEVITANPFLKNLTADGVLDWAAGKMREGMGVAAGAIDGRKIDPKAATIPISDAISLSKRVASARREQKVDLDALVKDDVASIRATGKPIGIDEDVAQSVMTPKELEDWQGDREDAGAFYEATADMVEVPEEEIRGRLNTLEPRAGEVGFARAEKLHEDVKKEADRIIKLRTDDPATSVADVPAVKEAAEAFDGANAAQSWDALMKARRAAQKSIGIQDDLQTVLTKEEARRFAAPIAKATDDQFFDRFDQLATAFEETFGEHADDALKQVVSEFIRDKDQATYAGRVIRSLIDRQAVPVSDARALDETKENSGMDAVAGSLSAQEEEMRALRREPGFQVGQRSAIEDARSGRVSLPPMVPDQAAIDYLRKNPETLADFIDMYGDDQVPADLRTKRNGRR